MSEYGAGAEWLPGALRKSKRRLHQPDFWTRHEYNHGEAVCTILLMTRGFFEYPALALHHILYTTMIYYV